MFIFMYKCGQTIKRDEEKDETQEEYINLEKLDAIYELY